MDRDLRNEGWGPEDCYPGELDAAYMDHAAKVFDTLQAQTIAGPHG